MEKLTKSLSNVIFLLRAGDCSLTDRFVQDWMGLAFRLGITKSYHCFRLNEEDGDEAEIVRADEMIEDAKALIAFWNGEDNDVKEYITMAKEAGIKTRIIRI